MTTLSNLTASGWTPVAGEYRSYPCDVCGQPAWFAVLKAPDCNATALAGIGGSSSDAYGIYCPKCDRNAMRRKN